MRSINSKMKIYSTPSSQVFENKTYVRVGRRVWVWFSLYFGGLTFGVRHIFGLSKVWRSFGGKRMCVCSVLQHFLTPKLTLLCVNWSESCILMNRIRFWGFICLCANVLFLSVCLFIDRLVNVSVSLSICHAKINQSINQYIVYCLLSFAMTH